MSEELANALVDDERVHLCTYGIRGRGNPICGKHIPFYRGNLDSINPRHFKYIKVDFISYIESYLDYKAHIPPCIECMELVDNNKERRLKGGYEKV